MENLLTAYCGILTLITVFSTLWDAEINRAKNLNIDSTNPIDFKNKEYTKVKQAESKCYKQFVFSLAALVIFFLPLINLVQELFDCSQWKLSVITIQLAYCFAYVYNIFMFIMIFRNMSIVRSKCRQIDDNVK